MAGDWIKMRSDLFTHPKVVRMSSALEADRLRTVGGLMSVWCLFDAHSIDGELEGYTFAAVDDHVRWTGFSAAMCAVGWLMESGKSLVLPEFDTHNGQSAKRRAQDADRKKEVRKTSASYADKLRTREEKRREEISTSLRSVDAAEATATKAKKGSRLPDGWQLPKAWGEWAMAEYPAWTAEIVRLEAAKFADHWHAKAGKDAAKLDWEATWRTWCRSDICQRSHAGKPSFAQQAADVARTTVPSRPDRDPVLLEIERHSAKAAPIPESIREKLQALKGGVLQ